MHGFVQAAIYITFEFLYFEVETFTLASVTYLKRFSQT